MEIERQFWSAHDLIIQFKVTCKMAVYSKSSKRRQVDTGVQNIDAICQIIG